MSALKIIKERKSIRAFSSEKIDDEKIQKLFEAAHWAASAYNEQPWRFYYTTRDNPEKFSKMLDCLVPFNQLWAKNAYMIVITAAKKKFDHNGKINAHAWYDLGQSVANLAIEATAQGLFVHQMSGFSSNKAGNLISVSEEFEPVTMMAIGYIGDADLLPDDLRDMEKKPRVRKDFRNILFSDF